MFLLSNYAIYNIPSLKFRGVGALGRVFGSKIIIKRLFKTKRRIASEMNSMCYVASKQKLKIVVRWSVCCYDSVFIVF